MNASGGSEELKHGNEDACRTATDNKRGSFSGR